MAYPLPNITKILDQLGKARYFLVLDLASGFHQIPINEEDAYKTAFSMLYGHYEFSRLSMGLKNMPSCFQCLMNRLLSRMQSIEMFVYMADIVIYSSNLKKHSEKLAKSFERLKTAGLTLQPDKCKFL